MLLYFPFFCVLPRAFRVILRFVRVFPRVVQYARLLDKALSLSLCYLKNKPKKFKTMRNWIILFSSLVSVFLIIASIWKGVEIIISPNLPNLKDVALFFFYAMSSKWVWNTTENVIEWIVDEETKENTSA